jgi:hypothetical protein
LLDGTVRILEHSPVLDLHNPASLAAVVRSIGADRAFAVNAGRARGDRRGAQNASIGPE